MQLANDNIEIISAPSILGLKPSGVQDLGKSLLKANLAQQIKSTNPVIHIETLNELYSDKREKDNCLNTTAIRNFSSSLGKTISTSLDHSRFPFVLGGDCSILVGIMPALREKGNYGLIFIDAHADFYEPEKSLTGEVADMDLAIITGRGPDLLTNINHLKPYVKDENVIHIGQRDQEETEKYGSQDIRDTTVKCFSYSDIEREGINNITKDVLGHILTLNVSEFWIHFDTDSLSDEINPAVDYRLPGGLSFEQIEILINRLLSTKKIIGIDITIFNPRMDKDGSIARNISESLGRAFTLNLPK